MNECVWVCAIGSKVKLHDGPEAMITGIKIKKAREGFAVLYEVTYFTGDNNCHFLTVEEFEVESLSQETFAIGFNLK